MSRAPSNSFSTTLDVRWSDQDLNGHVNNAQSITLMEEARVQAGITWTGTAPSTKTPRVVRALNTLSTMNYSRKRNRHVWFADRDNLLHGLSRTLTGPHCARLRETVIVVMIGHQETCLSTLLFERVSRIPSLEN